MSFAKVVGDENKDGKLSWEEMIKMLKNVHFVEKPKVVSKLVFMVTDTNKDGFIDFDEFVKIMHETGDMIITKLVVMEENFAAACEKDGTIKKEDAKHVIEELQFVEEGEFEEVWKRADSNKDGKLSLSEYIKEFYKHECE